MAPSAISPDRSSRPESLATLTAAYDDTIRFYLNGTRVVLDDVDPEVTVLEYLRGIGLTGTKLGCGEGGCGACTIVVSQYNPTTKKIYHASVNACLAPLVSLDGKHVITIEGVGNTNAPHPAQERIARAHGSQCGFCTPGIVMSLYALLRNNTNPTEHDVEEAFDGNLCRCTGYRSILDAAHTFTARNACAQARVNGGGGCCKETGRGEEDQKKKTTITTTSSSSSSSSSSSLSTATATTTTTTTTETSGSSEGCCKEDRGEKSTTGGGCCMENRDGPAKSKPRAGGCCMDSGNDAGEKKASGGGGCCMDKLNLNDQPIKRFTPPGFIEYHPDTEIIFPPALKKHELRPLAFGNKRKTWLRPVTLDQLLQIKHAYPDAKIIGGSTETQIEIKFKALQYPVSVYVGDIAELRQYTFTDDHLEIGGNVSLTDFEQLCDEAIKRYGPIRGQVFDGILRQLKYFAGRQIRNVGTPAGNLVTASPISDLNPALWGANAVLVAKSATKETEIPLSEFFVGYRKTSLSPDAVLASIRIPVTAARGEFYRAYKQAKRKDDDIAIVTAALRVKLDDDGAVKDCNLIFGGMAPTTVAAKTATEFLIGRQLAELDTLEGVMNALGSDFDLNFSVPGGMASYRKALALGFFYRFYHDVLSAIAGGRQLPHYDDEAIEEVERSLSKGQIDHESAAAYELAITGKPNPHLSALKQSTGEAQYTDDIPPQKNELYASYVLSTKPRAKILSIDYSAALDMPGVVDYVDKDDMPSPEANKVFAPDFDEVLFAEGEVHTAGQPIALILATSASKAQEAARAVKVVYEELPAILTIEEAIAADSYLPWTREIRTGNVEDAFTKCDYVFTGSARMGGQEHFYMETQGCIAIPSPEDGAMELFISTQNPSEGQEYASRVLGVSANKVVVRVKRLGGGFGGKETRASILSSVVALAAKKTKRPVRYMLPRDEDMIMSGMRHPTLGKYKVGFSKEGRILAMECDIYHNGGWSSDLSAGVCSRAITHVDGCYYIPSTRICGRICKTNTVSNTAFRGFGGPQGMFIAETFMEEAADRLGIPCDRLREINFYKPMELTPFNQPVTDWHVPLMFRQVKEEAQYAERLAQVEVFNSENRWRKRGLSLIPTKFGISFGALFLNQAGALVHIYTDGSILLAHGGTEMGQGIHTKMAQIAAQELQVPLDQVHISETATNTVPNTAPTAASATSDLNGMAVLNACQQLNKRLAPYREKLGPQATMKELAHVAYFDRVNLSAQGFYKTPDIGYDWDENKGKMYFYFTQGVAVAEVEVDTLTGTWTCLRADLKMDVGQSINPAIDYGQIQGAFMQGVGLFTMEEALWVRGGPMAGNLFTRGPGAYKIPGFRDIPQEFNVSLLKDVEWKDLRTIARSRGVGEPPLFLGSAVFFGIREALKAARREHGVQARLLEDEGEGLLRLESPATPERIRLACEDEIMRRARVVAKEGEKSFFVQI